MSASPAPRVLAGSGEAPPGSLSQLTSWMEPRAPSSDESELCFDSPEKLNQSYLGRGEAGIEGNKKREIKISELVSQRAGPEQLLADVFAAQKMNTLSSFFFLCGCEYTIKQLSKET